MIDELLNTKKAAEFLQLDQSRIRQLCIEGKIEAKKIGRDWIIKKEALNDYIKSTKNQKKTTIEDIAERYSKTL